MRVRRTVFGHHQETIDRLSAAVRGRDGIRALVIGGSIAHGFAAESSDVDVFFVIGEDEYRERLGRRELTYFNRELSTYEGGYIDGKYITVSFLKEVAKKGSEPARFAFKDAFVVFSSIEGLEKLIVDASRYPVEEKSDKIEKFYGQFEVWKWYFGEANKRGDLFLIHQVLVNYTLYAGRLILAFNEELYPYHKWFMRVLSDVKNKPTGLVEQIELVLRNKAAQDVERLNDMIAGFTDWGLDRRDWPNRFMVDTELAWMNGSAPVSEL